MKSLQLFLLVIFLAIGSTTQQDDNPTNGTISSPVTPAEPSPAPTVAPVKPTEPSPQPQSTVAPVVPPVETSTAPKPVPETIQSSSPPPAPPPEPKSEIPTEATIPPAIATVPVSPSTTVAPVVVPVVENVTTSAPPATTSTTTMIPIIVTENVTDVQPTNQTTPVIIPVLEVSSTIPPIILIPTTSGAPPVTTPKVIDENEKPVMGTSDASLLDAIEFQSSSRATCFNQSACFGDLRKLQCMSGPMCDRLSVTSANCTREEYNTSSYSALKSLNNDSSWFSLPAHWSCEYIPNNARYEMTDVHVICEGYRRSHDKWIYPNSCLLQYSLRRLGKIDESSWSNTIGVMVLAAFCIALACLAFKLYLTKRETGAYIPATWSMPLKAHLNFRRKRHVNEEEPVNVHFDMGQEQTTFGRRTYGTPE